ncbi:hypothetical protein N865_06570 [Intrasporangium oryzae NRRL B-24470]|uniref:L,D-TPase catalytic domain-containing protein n=1 Tax=Intrasporangium oryzae NRRL B-24470 TaxID=1386089 RepID=W9G874_9MICO|nr:Ig-like domain-containing protein [Intrasporangium oryzae]EWT02250.1 hypothetical protein N865_06570 [Intrasporangium oryzae NRRL B-24470]
MKLGSRSTVIAGMAIVALLGLSACNSSATADDGARTGSSSTAGTAGGSATPTPATEQIAWVTNPADQARNVAVDTRVTASTEKGTLTDASLSYVSKKGNTVKVEGWLESGTWTASDLLEPGVKYTLTLTGKDATGAETTTKRTFRTAALTLNDQIYVKVSPGDGATVGVGMPVIVTFDLPVVDKASFEKHMKVTSEPAQEGSWYWLSSREAHWRPKTYWQPGTKVHVAANLNGIPAGGGRYGQMSRTSDFTIGRSVIAKVNLKTDMMDVFINGSKVKTFPITGGRPGFETRSGVKVIMERYTNFTMKAETIGLKPNDPNYYADTTVKYALRLTNSGEFLHTAPWSVAQQGHSNVSHGCTGMSEPTGDWVWANMRIGDVVETTGTNRPMTMGNGYADWNLSWQAFQQGSAL